MADRKIIVEFKQSGEVKSDYGRELLKQTVSVKLSWSHYLAVEEVRKLHEREGGKYPH